ncbi:MAG: hypothetical protein V7711_16080 [Pseudomonadales bacterium]
MNLEYFPLIVGTAMALMAAVYSFNFRRHPAEQYVPAAAWLRAGIYFCFCYLCAWYSGALEAALSRPIATEQQTYDPIWRAWVAGLFVLVTVGYWVIWARFTIRFERKLDLLPQIIFGLFWGLAAGFLFLSFWHVVRLLGPELPVWAVWLISYFAISIWQWLWQDYGWDVYISPEHDCPWSIMVKVPATHIPNVTFCLIFFAIYGNHWIFVALQTWALLGASIAMRMPAPWSKESTPAARRVPGLFGASRARASGYQVADPTTDPYVKSTGLPAGTAIWVLAAHLFTMLCPVILLAVVQQNMVYLDSVLYEPRLLFVGAGLIMLAGAVEIAQNSFQHHWYSEGGTPGFFDSVFGTLLCLAMATMITASFGQSVWLVISVYCLALAYPVLHLIGKARGIARGALGILLVVAMYYAFGDPIVFMSLIAVFFTLYFYRLLNKTKAQSFHGFLAGVSAFGMLCIPVAIYHGSQGVSTPAWQVFAAAAVVLIAALLLWPWLSKLQPTPNDHGLVSGS